MSVIQKRNILSALLLMVAFGFTNSTLGYFVSPVTKELGCSRAAFNLYFTIMSMITFLVSPLYGKILQKYSVKWVMGIGLLGGAAAFLLFSAGHVIYTFYAAAALIGLVQGGATSMSAVVLIDRTFPDNPGSAMGIAMSGSGVCSVAMSLVLPAFIERFGWSNGYRLQAILWSVSFGAAMLLVRENMPIKKCLRHFNSPAPHS